LANRAHNMLLFTVIAVSVLLLSQAIGLWVNSSIPQNTTVELNSFIHFTHIRNFGGVFGLAQGSGWLFALVSIGLLLAVSAYLWLSPDLQRYEYICFGFVVGGGASNIVDRLLHGSVIDFIDIQHIPFWNYVFNTADVMIHAGIWPLLILSFVFGAQAGKNDT
jgi:signal peptidase II